MNYQYLIITLVIIGSITITSSAYAQDSDIPSWIKNTAGWWANDEVEDQEFFSLIEFLIESEIITVSNNQDESESNSEKVQELENQLQNLKRQTVSDIQNAYDDGYQDGRANRPEVSQEPVYEYEYWDNGNMKYYWKNGILIDEYYPDGSYKKNYDENGILQNVYPEPTSDATVYSYDDILILINGSNEQQTFTKSDVIKIEGIVSVILPETSVSYIISSLVDGNLIMIGESTLDNFGSSSFMYYLDNDLIIENTVYEVQMSHGESSGSIRFLVEEF